LKATEALQAARSFNVQINLCGDNLALDAPEAPPERVLDALRATHGQPYQYIRQGDLFDVMPDGPGEFE